jgi:pimeloyl-ACP methyl ester carboxylesterase
LLILLLSCASLTVWAEPVQLTMPNQQVAEAEYRKGDAGKPAVILLHGFLQTHEFPTIHRLIEGISDSGYTVLAPNLTLGVTHRRQSLACEAIHTHTMRNVVREISTWVQWLKVRHPGPIILIGHSFGSAELLAYLSGKPDPVVRKFIGISLVEGRLKLDEREIGKLVAQLRKQAADPRPHVVTHQFSFCQQYQATPASMASYLEWSPKRILNAINRLTLPHVFIMGGHDDRLGVGWIDKLQRHNRVLLISGANHFMDGEHEFDLLDDVLAELKLDAP